jgi:hypothetical protein
VLASGAEFALGSAFSGQSTSGGVVMVTQWGGAAAEASPWVMLGAANFRNYLMSGVLQKGYDYANAASWYVLEDELSSPAGIESFKSFFGQRICQK